MSNFTQTAYAKESFHDLAYEKEIISHVEFESCTFQSCKLYQCTFDHCRFVGCTFKKCDLSVAEVKTSSFVDCRFEDTKAIGINWFEVSQETSLATTVSFHASVINYCVFGKANWKGLRITSCEAHDVDFAESNLEKADFSDTDLKDSVFSNTNLQSANFTGAYNYLINPTTNNVRKAIFSLPYAVGLLQPFHITVQDADGEKLLSA